MSSGNKKMTLQEVIRGCEDLDDELVVYAEKIDGKFHALSETCLLALTEDEQDMHTDDIAKLKCPGFTYCLEVYLIQELMRDMNAESNEMSIDAKVARIIYYMENDA